MHQENMQVISILQDLLLFGPKAGGPVLFLEIHSSRVHLNQLMKVFRSTRSLQTGVLDLKSDLQEQDWALLQRTNDTPKIKRFLLMNLPDDTHTHNQE